MRGAVILLLIAGAVTVAAAVLPACGRGSTPDDAGVTTVSYGPGDQQVADLWLPEGSGPHPVVVLIHGGFWQGRFRRDLMDGLAADVRARGMAAWNLEYRRLGTGGGWPATFDDVAAGLDALRGQAKTHGLDLDRVTFVGHSAGGQLALWLGSRTTAAVRPRLIVALAPVTDLVTAAAQPSISGLVRSLLGGPPDRVADRYAAVSPLALVPIAAPQLIVEAESDGIIDPADNAAFLAAAAKAGGDTEHLVVPGDHFALIDAGSTAWERVRERL